MGYDNVNSQVRREVSRTVQNTSTNRFAVYQKGRLKGVHAVVVTAGTNGTNAIEVTSGTTTFASLAVGTNTAGSIISSDIAAASEAIAAGAVIQVANDSTDATGDFEVVCEVEADWDATQSA